jgi:hypothetical protein
MAWLAAHPGVIEALFWSAVVLWFVVPLTGLWWFFSRQEQRQREEYNGRLYSSVVDIQLRKERGD